VTILGGILTAAWLAYVALDAPRIVRAWTREEE
jgi:hypothetical protein